MKAKFKEAGYETPEDRLDKIGREVLSGAKNDASKAFDRALAKVSGDAELLFHLSRPFHKEMIRRWLAPLAAEIRRGPRQSDNHGSVAATSAGHDLRAPHAHAAGATNPDVGAPIAMSQGQISIAPASGPRSASADILALRPVVQKSILDTFFVTDYHKKHQIPLGDLAVSGLLKRASSAGRYAWVSARERELYLMIAAAASKQAHIPRNSRIRDIFSPEQVKEWVEMAGGSATHPDLSSFRTAFRAGVRAHA